MVQDLVESRVANPFRLVDWGGVEEGQPVVCACCGWAGRLGDCAQGSANGARSYACRECAMVMVARVFPKVYPARFAAAAQGRRVFDRLAANF